jgi:hypothetical protein
MPQSTNLFNVQTRQEGREIMMGGGMRAMTMPEAANLLGYLARAVGNTEMVAAALADVLGPTDATSVAAKIIKIAGIDNGAISTSGTLKTAADAYVPTSNKDSWRQK